MRVVLIEDEEEASDRLIRLIREIEPDVEVMAVLESIEGSVDWINTRLMSDHQMPDLYFMDVHLADGPSFEIFRETNVNAPVIFTTAYDQYAIDAFKVNSIDYLLKPVKKEDLQQALKKYHDLKDQNQAFPEVERILKLLEPQREYQKRIMVRYGPHIKVFQVEEAAYFYTHDKMTFICTFDSQKVPVDHTLDELEAMLDPIKFFRINRQFIVSYPSIEQLYSYPKSRIKVILKPNSDLESVVSSERSASFKQWLLGK